MKTNEPQREPRTDTLPTDTRRQTQPPGAEQADTERGDGKKNQQQSQRERRDPPPPQDPRDEASWESFPASDAPAH